jgi:hypothetical protein
MSIAPRADAQFDADFGECLISFALMLQDTRMFTRLTKCRRTDSLLRRAWEGSGAWMSGGLAADSVLLNFPETITDHPKGCYERLLYNLVKGMV